MIINDQRLQVTTYLGSVITSVTILYGPIVLMDGRYFFGAPYMLEPQEAVDMGTYFDVAIVFAKKDKAKMEQVRASIQGMVKP